MQLPKILNTNGFSLVELLVSLAALSIVIGAGLSLTTSTYYSALLALETSTLKSLLIEARNKSLAYQSSYGLLIEPTGYVLFRTTETPTQENSVYTERNRAISITAPEYITFTSGSSAGSTTIVLSLGTHNKTISLQANGKIE